MKILIIILLTASMAFAEIRTTGYTNPDNMPTFKELCDRCIYFDICVEKENKRGCIELIKINGKEVLIYRGELSITEFWRTYLKEDKNERLH